MKFFEISDYRQLIKIEFDKRKEKNSRFSLRAFAKLVGISPATLSEVLNGRHQLSVAKAYHVCQSLKWSKLQQGYFLALVESTLARTQEARDQATLKLLSIRKSCGLKEINQDLFNVLGQWYHFAIVDLMHLEGWDEDPSWISKKLDISVNEAKRALQRLDRLKLIERSAGRLRPTNTSLSVPDGLPSAVIQKYHEEFIHKGLKALRQYPVDLRYFLSLTLTLNEMKYKDMTESIRKFFEGLITTSSSDEYTADRMYGVSVQFFPISFSDTA